MTSTAFETVYPIIQEPVIEHPSFHIYHTQDELPRGIQYSSTFEVTAGRVTGDTSQVPEVGNFEAVSPYPLISDVLPNQYRGIYFEDSKLPVNDPSPYEVLPSNYELDLEQITYTDGTVLNPSGFALQRAIQEYELTKQEAERYNKQGNLEMANRMKENMNRLADEFAEIRQQEIQDELDVVRNQHLIQQRRADLQASAELPDVLFQLEKQEKEITRLIELTQQRGEDTTSLETARLVAQGQITGLREHLLGGHNGELPDIIAHSKSVVSQLENQLTTEFSGLFKKRNSENEMKLPTKQEESMTKEELKTLAKQQESFEGMSKKDLQKLAKSRGLKGVSKLNKADLIEKLKINPYNK